MLQGFPDQWFVTGRPPGQHAANQDHVGQPVQLVFSGQFRGRQIHAAHVRPADSTIRQGGIDVYPAVFRHSAFILVQRGQVHGQQNIRLVHDRRGHRLVPDDHGAIGGAAAHFRPVRRQPADLLSLQHPHNGQKLARKQDALSSKACNEDSFCHSSPASLALLSLYTPTG